jgi:outer membrane lipoprotein-sorting protein
MRYWKGYAVSLIAGLLLGSTVSIAAAETTPAAAECQSELRRLLARFSSIPGLSARFREEKHIALLIRPIVSQGSVYFAAPKRFARHVDQPEKSRLVIDQSELRIVDASGKHSISLESQPILRIIVGTFVQVLSGDRRALERSYRIAFKGTATGEWSMTLNPKKEVLSRVLKEVRVQGREAIVERLEIRETNGDRTVTTFFDVDISRQFSAAEQKRFFLIGPKP